MATTASSSNLFDPNRWGLPDEAVAGLGDQLRAFWQRYRPCVRTRTRDPSEHCYTYWRGLLTMEDPRNFANMERRIHGGDGQALQQFVSDSPWAMQGMFYQIRTDIAARPALRTGGLIILDESAN